MKKLGGNKVNSVIIASVAAASIAIAVCLVMIFVKTSNYTSKEIVNGLSASFDIYESVANIAETMSDTLADDGEEALELAEINAVDYRMEAAAE